MKTQLAGGDRWLQEADLAAEDAFAALKRERLRERQRKLFWWKVTDGARCALRWAILVGFLALGSVGILGLISKL